MIVTWQVEDGYVGGGRPQRTVVPDDELAECESDEERERLIDSYVTDDFGQKISWRILSRK